jgi:hypothetical protein
LSEPELLDARPRRRASVWMLRLGVLLFLGIAAFIFVLARFDAKLKQAESQLDQDDPGWRLDDIEANRAVIPEEENSARVVVAAADLFPVGVPIADWPPVDLVNALSNRPPQESLSPDEYGRLCNELNELEAALAEGRKLSGMPRGRHHLVYTRPNLYSALLKDQQLSRQVANLMRLSAVRHAEDGDLRAALSDCRAIVNSGRSIGDEPLLISMLIRNACVNLGCTTVRDVLAQGEPPLSELTALQTLLADEDAFPDLLTGVRGERGAVHEMVIGVNSGALSLKNVSGGAPSTAEDLLSILLRPKFKSEHPEILSLMTRYVEAARLPMHEQAAVEETLNAEIRSTRFAILTRLIVPAVGHVAAFSRRKHAWMRCLIACLAAERYRQVHHEWPVSLDALVPAELSAVPIDPFDGHPIRYRKLADGVVLYSIGQDGTDDGGNLAEGANFLKPGTDLGFRMWNVDRRRQKPVQ